MQKYVESSEIKAKSQKAKKFFYISILKHRFQVLRR